MDEFGVIGSIYRSLARGKYFLLWMVFISLIAGVLKFALAGRRYRSTATVLPGSSDRPGFDMTEGGLPDLSVLMGRGSGESSMMLYPDILRSRRISIDILRRTFVFEDHGKTAEKTLQEYLCAPNDDAALFKLRSRVARFWIDGDSGTLVIQVTTGNPVLSSLVARAYIERLEQYNRTERRASSEEVYDFIRKKRDMSRIELAEADDNLEAFRKMNRDYANSTEPGLLMELRRLGREVEIKQALCLELGKQAEKAALDSGRDTPILSVLDYGEVPEKPFYPDPVRILISFLLAGLITGAVLAVIRDRVVSWKMGEDRDTVDSLLEELKNDLRAAVFIKTTAGE